MVWPGEVWPDIHVVYDLTGMAWYIIWSGEVWHGMWKCVYVNFMFYGISLGYSPVHMWRSRCQLESCSHVQDRLQVEGPLHACSVHMYSSCSQ